MRALDWSLVTWNTVIGSPAQPFVQALVPGGGVPLRLILFQEEEVRDGFDGHQADLRVEGLVFAEADLACRHGGGQALVFLLAEGDQQGLHLLGHGLLGTIG